MVFNFCAEEPQYWKINSQEQVIGDYVATRPEQFSEFQKLLETTGMSALLNTRGPYTLFLPTNEAMYAYYSFKNVSSLMEFSDSSL